MPVPRQPLRPVLRPETTADDKWFGGFEAGWMDFEKKIYYSGLTREGERITVRFREPAQRAAALKAIGELSDLAREAGLPYLVDVGS